MKRIPSQSQTHKKSYFVYSNFAYFVQINQQNISQANIECSV